MLNPLLLFAASLAIAESHAYTPRVPPGTPDRDPLTPEPVREPRDVAPPSLDLLTEHWHTGKRLRRNRYTCPKCEATSDHSQRCRKCNVRMSRNRSSGGR